MSNQSQSHPDISENWKPETSTINKKTPWSCSPPSLKSEFFALPHESAQQPEGKGVQIKQLPRQEVREEKREQEGQAVLQNEESWGRSFDLTYFSVGVYA